MIPPFNIHGVVPPVRPAMAGHSPNRSPYPVDILKFCEHFGTSAPRLAILRGLLELRECLRTIGLVDGHQWLNGSFVENIEHAQNHSPNDIDVVTFAVLGDKDAQERAFAAAPELFTNSQCKERFKVDHYVLAADRTLTERNTRRVGYWYSMWSHQRDTGRWKGFVSVGLASNDSDAGAWLDSQDLPEGDAP